MLQSLLELKELIDTNFPQLILNIIPTKRNNRISVYFKNDPDKKEFTLLNYIVFTDSKQDKFLSGYFVLQKWWLSFLSEKEKEFWLSKSPFRGKNGLKLFDIDINDIRKILQFLVKEKSSIEDDQSLVIHSQKTSHKLEVNKRENKHLTSKQLTVIKECNEYTCDSCGVNLNLAEKLFPERGYSLMKGKLIQVHHKIRNLTSKPRNHIDNLTTLCTICHGHQEGNGHHFQREAKEHHDVIKEIRKQQGINI